MKFGVPTKDHVKAELQRASGSKLPSQPKQIIILSFTMNIQFTSQAKAFSIRSYCFSPTVSGVNKLQNSTASLLCLYLLVFVWKLGSGKSQFPLKITYELQYNHLGIAFHTKQHLNLATDIFQFFLKKIESYCELT